MGLGLELEWSLTPTRQNLGHFGYNSVKSKQRKILKNKTIRLVQSPFTTLGQEARWATTLPDPTRGKVGQINDSVYDHLVKFVGINIYRVYA